MATHTINGKAFEFACLEAIRQKMQQDGKPVSIEDSPAYETAKRAFESQPDEAKQNLTLAAATAARLLFPLEPKLENAPGELYLGINADAAAMGVNGDVRDVLCIRYDERNWEIGLSCKHNHEALKHPRITADKDFGADWVGYQCSEEFIREISPIIDPLVTMGQNRVKWRDIPNKHDDYYVPILQAYLNEIERMCQQHPDVPTKLLHYFFGSRDFYKVIAHEKNKTTTIEAFNMAGTLGSSYGRIRPLTPIAVLRLPTRLFNASFKTNSKTTIILTFDMGWTVSMRLHNKDEIARPTSLAWNVELEGLPHGTYVNTHSWYE